MKPRQLSVQRRHRSRIVAMQSGFTIIEIMIAASVGWAFSPAHTLQG